MTENFSEELHDSRYFLQYEYIPMLVAGVNDGYLPPTALHMVKEWPIWESYEWELGFYADRLDVDDNHMVIFYNFPEPQGIPEALYGAVLVNKLTDKAEYYTLESSYNDSWMLGSMTTESHRCFGPLGTRDRSKFLEWVVNKIAR